MITCQFLPTNQLSHIMWHLSSGENELWYMCHWDMWSEITTCFWTAAYTVSLSQRKLPSALFRIHELIQRPWPVSASQKVDKHCDIFGLGSHRVKISNCNTSVWLKLELVIHGYQILLTKPHYCQARPPRPLLAEGYIWLWRRYVICVASIQNFCIVRTSNESIMLWSSYILA